MLIVAEDANAKRQLFVKQSFMVHVYVYMMAKGVLRVPRLSIKSIPIISDVLWNEHREGTTFFFLLSRIIVETYCALFE